MLRMRMAVSGAVRRIWRLATAPFMLGSAKSITTTRGRSSNASSTAWCPSSASPTTRMSWSSSNMRRNPRRTRLWSSTSRTEIAGSGMRLLAMSLLRQYRHRKTHQGATRAAVLEFQTAVHQFRSLTHGNHAHPVALRTSETDTIIFHFKHHGFRQIPQANRRLLALGMLGDIVERFLHHTIEVDCDAAVQFPAGARFLVLYRNAGLLLETRQILTERALKSDFVEDHGMERVGQRTNFVQRGLNDLLHLAQIGAQRIRILRQAFSSALQHGSDRRQDLAEIIVKVAGNRAECILLHGNQLPGQFAATRGKDGNLFEQTAVVVHQVKAGEQNQHQHRRHEQIDVALHAGINAADADRRLLLGLVVLHQKPRHRRAESFLPGLER